MRPKKARLYIKLLWKNRLFDSILPILDIKLFNSFHLVSVILLHEKSWTDLQIFNPFQTVMTVPMLLYLYDTLNTIGIFFRKKYKILKRKNKYLFATTHMMMSVTDPNFLLHYIMLTVVVILTLLHIVMTMPS